MSGAVVKAGDHEIPGDMLSYLLLCSVLEKMDLELCRGLLGLGKEGGLWAFHFSRVYPFCLLVKGEDYDVFLPLFFFFNGRY